MFYVGTFVLETRVTAAAAAACSIVTQAKTTTNQGPAVRYNFWISVLYVFNYTHLSTRLMIKTRRYTACLANKISHFPVILFSVLCQGSHYHIRILYPRCILYVLGCVLKLIACIGGGGHRQTIITSVPSLLRLCTCKTIMY